MRPNVTRIRKQCISIRDQKIPIVAESYVLCERSSGIARFRVEAESAGSLPVEKIASLLAVHCLVRGQAPEDYELMIVSRDSLLVPVAERAQQLLVAGRNLGAGVKISRREQDVLDGILHNLTNKEIAKDLNVSERTVKFHVSSLLAKFGVGDRMALSREVSLGRSGGSRALESQKPKSLFGFPIQPGRAPAQNATDSKEVARADRRVLSIPGRERYAT